jgi:hypothetical protein
MSAAAAELNGPRQARGLIGYFVQFFHHIEHLLLVQAQSGHNLAGRPVPTSLIQFFVPRVELRLFYNTIVFIPIVVAMYYHIFPTVSEVAAPVCTCRWHALAVAAAGA